VRELTQYEKKIRRLFIPFIPFHYRYDDRIKFVKYLLLYAAKNMYFAKKIAIYCHNLHIYP